MSFRLAATLTASNRACKTIVDRKVDLDLFFSVALYLPSRTSRIVTYIEEPMSKPAFILHCMSDESIPCTQRTPAFWGMMLVVCTVPTGLEKYFEIYKQSTNLWNSLKHYNLKDTIRVRKLITWIWCNFLKRTKQFISAGKMMIAVLFEWGSYKRFFKNKNKFCNNIKLAW